MYPLIVCFLVLLVSCAIQNDPPAAEIPEFKLTPARQEDLLVAAYEKDVIVFDVQSASGIGSATIELISGRMPGTVIVRLHTRGLEEFRLSYAETTVAASIPSGEMGGDAMERLLTPAGETSITARHPLWMEVRVISTQAAPEIPFEDGYFEITLPKDLGTSFEIAWVDFYR
jgi:hypothetical protein